MWRAKREPFECLRALLHVRQITFISFTILDEGLEPEAVRDSH